MSGIVLRCWLRHSPMRPAGSSSSPNPLDDPPAGFPVDPRQPASRGPICLGRQPTDGSLKVPGEAGTVAGEPHGLGQRPMLGTAQPSEPRVHLRPPDPGVEMPPDHVEVLLHLPMCCVGALVPSGSRRGSGRHLPRIGAFAGIEANQEFSVRDRWWFTVDSACWRWNGSQVVRKCRFLDGCASVERAPAGLYAKRASRKW